MKSKEAIEKRISELDKQVDIYSGHSEQARQDGNPIGMQTMERFADIARMQRNILLWVLEKDKEVKP